MFSFAILPAQGQSSATPQVAVDIDQHALAAPPDAERSLDHLANYLCKPARSEHDRARAIFRWMTDRISFDVDAFYTGTRGVVRPEAVLQHRQALCHGYTALFSALAQRAGLESATIPGYVHGIPVSGMEEEKTRRPNHAWNAVRIDSRWYFVDAAWGAGHVKQQRFHRFVQDQYFLTPPHQMIMTHFPADVRWQLLARPMTLEEFDSVKAIDVGFFRLGSSRLFRPGDKRTPPDSGRPPPSEPYKLAHVGSVKVMSAPSGSTLEAMREYYFLVEAPQAEKMILLNNKKWMLLNKTGNRFEASIRPEPGTLKLFLKPYGRDEVQRALAYEVRVP